MSTADKSFKVKNGLNVAGTATFGSSVVLGETPLRFDTATNKLQIQLNGTWSPIAFSADIPDTTQQLSFMDIGLSIDYNGQPTYIIQGNGVTISGDSKFVVGGLVATESFDLVFDSGVIS